MPNTKKGKRKTTAKEEPGIPQFCWARGFEERRGELLVKQERTNPQHAQHRYHQRPAPSSRAFCLST